MAETAASAPTAEGRPRRWRPQRSARRPLLLAAIVVVALIGSAIGLVLSARASTAAIDRPRLTDFAPDATVDGAIPPAGRLARGAVVASGPTAKARLNWDGGALADLGGDGHLTVRAEGMGIDLRDGLFGALVAPQPDGRRFVVGTPFGEVVTSDGQFTVILSSVAAVVHVDAGHVRVRPNEPAGAAEREAAVGETVRLERAAKP